jgi:hypothetical protein
MCKPVILLAFANDLEDEFKYLRRLSKETNQLVHLLQTPQASEFGELVLRTNCSYDDILSVFQDVRYRDRIFGFHYGGHANSYQLLLQSTTGEAAEKTFE